jgi:P27 family predicted phage terminase small subunit
MQSAVFKIMAADRQASATPIPPPATLDVIGAAKWRELLPELQARGAVSAGDLVALECLCSSWSLWQTAQAQVAKSGLLAITPQGKLESPFLAIARKAQVAVRQWAAELRITPKSRKLGDVVLPRE